MDPQSPSASSLRWAVPKDVTSLNECFFYHKMDIPGYGTVEGDWDLRSREKTYLGNVDVAGKRVLEIGPANGQLTFAMERMGADVTTYDLSEDDEWDVVPYAGTDIKEYHRSRRKNLLAVSNGFWLAHKAFNSKAKLAYGKVYDVPDEIGMFEICTFGTMLLHLRDPFLALQRVTAHASETAIITDMLPKFSSDLPLDRRLVEFLPNSALREPYETWWLISPELNAEFLRILGFPYTTITYHSQLFRGKEAQIYTVVGHRSQPKDYESSSANSDIEISSITARNQRIDQKLLDQLALERLPISDIFQHVVDRTLKRLKN